MDSPTYKERKKKYLMYLKSMDWQVVRLAVLERDNNKCKVCGSNDNLQVHHWTYENLYNELEHLDDLITVCERHHQIIHKC